ncbi:MAG TPA: hypothetical protein VNJ29_00205 [Candidatus Nitrosotenuis sp.]|nr:hypothetical protein [Candidatus Nitrosotenuis sp.]
MGITSLGDGLKQAQLAEHTHHSDATRGGEANGHEAPKKAENVMKK